MRSSHGNDEVKISESGIALATSQAMPLPDQLFIQLDQLAAFECGPFPVVSLYLNMRPDNHGRDYFEPFLRKELGERLRAFHAEGPERKSLGQDAEKIRAYVNEVDPSVDGLAIFSCTGADFFEAVVLPAPIDRHRLYIADQPHLYPLARVLEASPRFAVLLADTNSARLFVVAGNAVQQAERVEGVRTRRHKMGGWAQARYQRHIDNYHLHHAKEVAETLARVVREEGIDSIIISGNDGIVPLLKEHFSKEVSERIVDVIKLGAHAPEREILDATVAAMRVKDAETDRERVEALLGAYRANGLACVGVDETRLALDRGQVDELVIATVPEALDTNAALADPATTAVEQIPEASPEGTPEERIANELVVKARQTSAKIRFIEETALMAAVGGVGAFLRFKL
jgi:peptide subunit release factor 1 (eRF1)